MKPLSSGRSEEREWIEAYEDNSNDAKMMMERMDIQNIIDFPSVIME
jgi:hypothetical protein